MRKKSISRKEQILQAAFVTVCRQGYYETRIDDVARRAGVAKGTVYLYFRDKPDLYLGIIRWLLSQAYSILAETAGQPVSARARLSRVFQTWTEKLLPYPGATELIFPEMNRERCNLNRRFREQVLPEIRRLLDGIAGIIVQGIEQGEFRPVEPRLAALHFLNAFRSGLLLMSRELRIGSAPEQSLDLFFQGITLKKKGGK
ncbi:MAG: TetR/AcrR family transcriptional regulator [candidate division WOR-3 bacterium]